MMSRPWSEFNQNLRSLTRVRAAGSGIKGGPHDSVIGVKSELAISRMRDRQPVRFEPAEGGVRLEGVVVTCSDDGKARGIEAIRVDA